MARYTSASSRPPFLQVLEGLVLTVGILYLGKPFIVPLALAVLITFVLTPIVHGLQKLGLGRIPSVLAVVLIAFTVVGCIGWGVGLQIQRFASELPNHKADIEHKIASLRGTGEGAIGQLMRMIDEISSNIPDQNASQTAPVPVQGPIIIAEPNRPSTFERLTGILVPVLEPLAMAGLIVILVVFMLIRREDLRNRILGLLGHGYLTGTTRVFMDTAERVSNFLLSQFLVNAGFGIIFGIVLFFLGVPYAFLWAALAAILRFIPYIGTWVALAFPLLLSIATSESWTQPILVLVLFAILELITANIIEPLLFGHSTGVTPVALLVAAAFWTCVWGPIGLVLSTPLTVCLVVLGQHIPRFRFLSLLLGDEPALAAHASYYQRLLAQDKEEALEVVRTVAEQQGLDKAFDNVLLPALLLARRDRKQGGLTPSEEEFIYQATQEILQRLAAEKEPVPDALEKGSPEAPTATDIESQPEALVLGCPAHHEAEELSLQMLAQLLAESGCKMEMVSSKSLPAEIEARVEELTPKVVFIAVLPPGGLPQAGYLCRRLRKRFPKLPIVVGYWGTVTRNYDRILVQFRTAGASYVTTSLLQSKSQILALARSGAPTVSKPPRQPAGAS